jgi:DEAD/DEAH box helicase domain-containing protein
MFGLRLAIAWREPMLTAPPSNADEAIAALLASPDIAPLVAAHRELEPRPPRHAPWPDGVDPRLVSALRGRGIEALYTHQAAAYEAATAGRNVVVVTPTASGKTLC